MADKQDAGQSNGFDLQDFDEVFDAEIDAINARRKRLSNANDAEPEAYASTYSEIAPDVAQEIAQQAANAGDAKTKSQPADTSPLGGLDHNVTDIAGICMSGGGIRSAAFSIGVTQAMDALMVKRKKVGRKSPHVASAFEQMDYMSTVSGGGYTGSCITAAMAEKDAPFPFPSRLEKTEAPVLRHIRDHSNYLFPKGGRSEKLRNLASYLRGIFANVPSIGFLVLAAVLVTIWFCQNIPNVYVPSIFGYTLSEIGKLFDPDFESFKEGFFIVFRIFLLFLFVALVMWALFRSLGPRPRWEFKATGTRIISYLIGLALVIFVFELQPKMLSGLHALHCKAIVNSYNPSAELKPDVGPSAQSLFVAASCELTGLKSPDEIKAEFVKAQEAAENASDDEKPTTSSESEDDATLEGSGIYQYLLTQVQRLAAFLAAIAAVLGTLRSLMGGVEAGDSSSQSGLVGKARKIGNNILYSAVGLLLPLLLWLAYLYLSFWGLSGVVPESGLFFCHSPDVLTLFKNGNCTVPLADHTPGIIYAVTAIISLGLAILISTNKNSPHGMYRDSLARAFLVREADETSNNIGPNPVDELDRIRLSETGKGSAPFHIINAALNLQSSERANGRGRNAGFFTFSKNHSGSFETGYLGTAKLEELEAEGQGDQMTTFGLSSAMAVSAAAASTAMGSLTKKSFAITLAVLNVRLGYWFTNPKAVARIAFAKGSEAINSRWLRTKIRSSSFLLLLREMAGFMDEEHELVYLTDGGHLENLGLYSLLQRRCRCIIVVDAEADRALNFSSLVTAQRYARIDLGTRIDLSVDKIQKANVAAGHEYHGDKKPEFDPAPVEDRPHCAIGMIRYPKDEKGKEQKGVIFYIKSSLTGDENDYIRDYARRNPSFPHETTGDQFFSEEQFEVYRSLGFHCAFKALTGYAVVQDGNETITLRKANTDPAKQSKTISDAQKIWEEIFAEVQTRY